MTYSRRSSRRSFIGQSAVGAAALWAAPSFLRAAGANERLNLAFIGVGGRGGSNLNDIARNGQENVVAICDVNEGALDSAAQKYPKARKYVDFRKLFDDSNDIDAVVVSTCEHTHAYATLPALELGKHVYCEKPLTHNVVEARMVRLAAEKANVVTQMGTQMHAQDNFRRVAELVRSGVIGGVTEIHVWVSRAWGLQSAEDAKRYQDIVYVTDRPAEAMTPPANLKWDLWLGPAPERPYHEVYFPGPKWYRWWDFGNGTMSDLGSHWVDYPYFACELDAPKTVEAFHDAPAHPEIAPASLKVVYEYGPRGDKPACKLTWYQGEPKPQIWSDGKIPQWGNGILFVGEKGMLISDYTQHKLLPEEQFDGAKLPEPFLPRVGGQHHQEWVTAIKTGSPTGSPFSYAGMLTEANHLGNVAFRAGQKIEWDSANLKIPNAPDAERFLTREPRSGWAKIGV
ncbi:MAG TPA: Gfo/Idh/MocA family oxidoreductase [Pirellulaceae bacterium]|nr:Gfo/Idh/MocA family oxidoreductase [Pirellulaceae bacterium]